MKKIKKPCRFCDEKSMTIEYKNPSLLRRFIAGQGKIIPRTVTGTCAKHQKEITKAIKRARNIALMPYRYDVKQN